MQSLTRSRSGVPWTTNMYVYQCVGESGWEDGENITLCNNNYLIVCILVVGANVSFENRQPLAIREGQSRQLCVRVVSGSLPYEELFTVTPTELKKRKKRGDLPTASMLLLSIHVKIIA